MNNEMLHLEIISVYFKYHEMLQVFETYLQFVGIALTNAQIVETSRLEYERNRVSSHSSEMNVFVTLLLIQRHLNFNLTFIFMSILKPTV